MKQAFKITFVRRLTFYSSADEKPKAEIKGKELLKETLKDPDFDINDDWHLESIIEEDWIRKLRKNKSKK